MIFVIEDDAQNGPDHVDAHRSIALIVGPYVKQRAVISKHFNTVTMLRTMEEVLGIKPLGMNDAFQPPMTEIFSTQQAIMDLQSASACDPAQLRSCRFPLRLLRTKPELQPCSGPRCRLLGRTKPRILISALKTSWIRQLQPDSVEGTQGTTRNPIPLIAMAGT